MTIVNWQWCQLCCGQTIHKLDKCTQCYPLKYMSFSNQVKHITFITTVKANMQIASEYTIYRN